MDIAVDSNDNVHVIAKDSNGNLGYMTNAGGSWSAITTIDNTVPTGWEANMAIDLFDNIHVSYYDGSAFNGNLKYANNIGGSWTTKFVDNTPTRSGKYNSITTDSNGYAFPTVEITHRVAETYTMQLIYTPLVLQKMLRSIRVH